MHMCSDQHIFSNVILRPRFRVFLNRFSKTNAAEDYLLLIFKWFISVHTMKVNGVSNNVDPHFQTALINFSKYLQFVMHTGLKDHEGE